MKQSQVLLDIWMGIKIYSNVAKWWIANWLILPMGGHGGSATTGATPSSFPKTCPTFTHNIFIIFLFFFIALTCDTDPPCTASGRCVFVWYKYVISSWILLTLSVQLTSLFYNIFTSRFYCLVLFPTLTAWFCCLVLLADFIACLCCPLLLPFFIAWFCCLVLLPCFIVWLYCLFSLPGFVAHLIWQHCLVNRASRPTDLVESVGEVDIRFSEVGKCKQH